MLFEFASICLNKKNLKYIDIDLHKNSTRCYITKEVEVITEMSNFNTPVVHLVLVFGLKLSFKEKHTYWYTYGIEIILMFSVNHHYSP